MPQLPANIGRPEIPRKVGLGELQIVCGEGTLRSLLGSCIGLVLHDAKNHVGGMAHIVLPAAGAADQPLGKYADTAVPELIRRIEQAGGKRQYLAAKLAGGANMFSGANLNGIGEQNLAMVERLLKDLAIRIVAKHCGGQQGRRINYDVATGAVTVEIVGGEPIQL